MASIGDMDDIFDVEPSTSDQPCKLCVSRNEATTSSSSQSTSNQEASSNHEVDSNEQSSDAPVADSSSRKRKNGNASKSVKRKSSEPDQTLLDLTITCPICETKVNGTESFVNSHVDYCVEMKEECEEQQSYEWAGQSRIRTSYAEAKMFAGSTLVKLTYEKNDELIDIEDNANAVYGEPQYTESHISRCKVTSSSSSDEAPPSPQPSTSSRCEPEPSTSSRSSSTVTMDSLKARIKQLEKHEGSKCSVCLDVLRDPVVSVNCWHVYCEKCWLKSLEMKKLCPRCNVITTLGDLRRIYI